MFTFKRKLEWDFFIYLIVSYKGETEASWWGLSHKCYRKESNVETLYKCGHSIDRSIFEDERSNERLIHSTGQWFAVLEVHWSSLCWCQLDSIKTLMEGFFLCGMHEAIIRRSTKIEFLIMRGSKLHESRVISQVIHNFSERW